MSMWKFSRATRLFAVASLAFVAIAAGAIFLEHSLHAAAGHIGDVVMATPAGLAVISNSLTGLRERHGKLVAEMTAMIQLAEGEDRDLTTEEQTRFDTLKAERDGLDTRIARLNAQHASETASNAVIPAAARGNGTQPVPRRPNEASTSFENFGEFLHAVRFNRNDQRLTFVEGVGAQTDENGLQAEMRMDNDTQGGFMVPTQLRTQIMRVDPQAALVRPRAQIIPAGNPPDASVSMPALDQSGTNPANMFGGVEVKWIGEGEEKPETTAKLGEIMLTPHEVAGFVTVTDKLLRNWGAADSFIRNLLSGAVDAAEDYAFLRGSGVNQPLGALNAGATKFISRASANTITYPDLLNMVAVLLMRGGSPIWSMPQQALPKIATMTDPEGHYIWKPGAVDGFAGTLLGYPLRWNNRSPALGSKGDVLLADWNYYLVKDGSGPFVAASEHVKFTSNKTVIKIFWNVDGAPWLNAPIKEENGYEVTPFVGLDVPA